MILRDTVVLTKRSLRHILRSPDTIITTAITPVAMLLLFVYVFGGAIDTGARAEAHEQCDADDDHERDHVGDQRGDHVRPQHARTGDRHGLEPLEDAALEVQEQPVRRVGDARRDGDQQDPG